MSQRILVFFRVFVLWSAVLIFWSIKRGIQLLKFADDRIVKGNCDPMVELQDRSLYLATYGSKFNEKFAHPPPILTVLCSGFEFFYRIHGRCRSRHCSDHRYLFPELLTVFLNSL
jgi:hypothetical protein